MTVQAPEKQKRLPGRRLLTVDEFHRAGCLGIFKPDERLELIEGEVIQKVAPQASPHATAVRAVEVALGRCFYSGYDVRCQLPIALGVYNEPKPDIAVVVGSFRDYSRSHPTTAVLVVEVSDATLRLDRTVKAALYARAQIPEYWIINLSGRVLAVHRDPDNGRYLDITKNEESTSVTPLAIPEAFIPVEELLP